MGKRIDRRLHKRFKVREESFAFIENDSKILCKIKNISRGGISLVTIANADNIPELFDTDIFVTGRVFYLKDVPSKKISEFHENGKSLFSTFVKSRVGVQFGEIDGDQAAQLQVFLKNYATIEDISEL
ncbi:MAG: PilZ domain-containing protein [Desulfobacteraceae bacterium]|nr:PilZ domain-containing protein [Desulfobacteraceae bacterium]MBC2757444.1 PilZ domain-containing protein [Desulfobacteraceae bacterium]